MIGIIYELYVYVWSIYGLFMGYIEGLVRVILTLVIALRPWDSPQGSLIGEPLPAVAKSGLRPQPIAPKP